VAESKVVLVTGASGFVGGACLPILAERGYVVHALGRRLPVGGPPPGVSRWHEVDLLSDSVERLVAAVAPTHVVHLAWVTERGRFWLGLENLSWVEASLRLFGAAARHGARRLLFVGSGAEYALTNEPSGGPGQPGAGSSLYAVSKDATRRVLEAAAAAHGVSFAWARLFFPYGPGDAADKLVPTVIQSLLAGRAAECTAGTQVRDLLYIEDVAEALVAVLDSPASGPIDIASGVGVALRDVLLRIAAITGRADLLRLGVRPMAAHEAPRWVGAADRLRDDVGWQPKVALDDGLSRTVEYHRRASAAGLQRPDR